MTDLKSTLDAADRGLGSSLDRLDAFLRIPSVSADPAYDADCRRAAEWAAEALSDIGFDASPRRTIFRKTLCCMGEGG